MGQEVKNPLRAQSKYGLMGSSAKTGKKIIEGHRSSFWIKLSFGIGHPPAIHQMQSTCVGRVQGSQIFKQNSIISIRSKVMAFLVILLSPWSPHCLRHPHIVPIIPTSSLCHPHHPHIISIALRRPPCGHHSCGLCGLRCLCGLHPMLSLWSLSSPRHPHIIPIIPTLFLCCTRHPHIVPIAPRRSPCGPHGCGLCGLCCLHGLHPMLSSGPRCPHVIPTSSPSSSRHPCHPHIV